MKKLPIIGLLIGAVVAFFAARKRKHDNVDPDLPNPDGGASA